MLPAGDIAIRITFSKHFIFRVLAFRLIDYSCRFPLLSPWTDRQSFGGVSESDAGLGRGENEKQPTAAAICSKAGYFFGKTYNLGSGTVDWYREGGGGGGLRSDMKGRQLRFSVVQ